MQHTLNETGFPIQINISVPGEIVGVIFMYKTILTEFFGAKEIYNITTEIMENIKFTPPEKFGCNIIKVQIPFKRQIPPLQNHTHEKSVGCHLVTDAFL